METIYNHSTAGYNWLPKQVNLSDKQPAKGIILPQKKISILNLKHIQFNFIILSNNNTLLGTVPNGQLLKIPTKPVSNS